MKNLILICFALLALATAVTLRSTNRVHGRNRFRMRAATRSKHGAKTKDTDNKWIGIVQAKRIRGLPIELDGPFDWRNWGFSVDSNYIPQELNGVFIENVEMLRVIQLIGSYEAKGQFHAQNGKPPAKEDNLDTSAAEFSKTFADSMDLSPLGKAVMYRMFEDCKFEWVAAEESFTTGRGIAGNMLSHTNGYVSNDCKPAIFNFYSFGIYPNTKAFEGTIHDPGNLELFIKECGEAKVRLQADITTYLEKYQTVLDITDIKKQIANKMEDFHLELKQLLINLERFSDLWGGFGIESQLLGKAILELKKSILMNDDDYFFSRADTIQLLMTPALITEYDQIK